MTVYPSEHYFSYSRRLSRLFVDVQTVLSYSGNRSFSGFQELMESVQRLGERPDAWPSTLASLNPVKHRPKEVYGTVLLRKLSM